MGKEFSKYSVALKNQHIKTDFDPPVIYLESVKGCPLSCAMCKYRQTKPQRMPSVLLQKIEPYFKNLEVLAIHGQGEPLLGDIEYFVNQSVMHDFVLHMNTNGLLLTEKIADLLLKTRLSIRFSVHSGTPETYEKIMGSDLNRALKNISYIVKKSKESIKDCDLWFSFIVMKENIDEIEDFLHLTHDCGIKRVRFEQLYPSWRSLKGDKIRNRNFTFRYFEQFNKNIRNNFMERIPDYQSLSNELGIDIKFGSSLSHNKRSHQIKEIINTVNIELLGTTFFPLRKIPGACAAPWIGQLVINHEGDVRLCCERTYTLGNLYESTLAEIWNSKKIMAIRKSFHDGFNPRICGYCGGFGLSNYPKNSFFGKGE